MSRICEKRKSNRLLWINEMENAFVWRSILLEITSGQGMSIEHIPAKSVSASFTADRD